MNLQMDQLHDPLTTHSSQTCSEISIKSSSNWQFRCIDGSERKARYNLFISQTQIQSDYPEPLLMLIAAHDIHRLLITNAD